MPRSGNKFPISGITQHPSLDLHHSFGLSYLSHTQNQFHIKYPFIIKLSTEVFSFLPWVFICVLAHSCLEYWSRSSYASPYLASLIFCPLYFDSTFIHASIREMTEDNYLVHISLAYVLSRMCEVTTRTTFLAHLMLLNDFQCSE